MTSIPSTSGIYKITCIPTGKIYIGSAIDLRQRWNQHTKELRGNRHHNAYLQAAWNKYQESAFAFNVIELVLSPFLLEREQYWLDKHKSYIRNNGFNLYRTAGSPLGSKHSDASRQKMSLARKGRTFGPLSPKHRAAVSKGLMGRPMSDLARRKLLEAHLGKKRVFSDTHRENISAAQRGKPHPTKYWIVTSPGGVEYEVSSLKRFCQEHGLVRSMMVYVAQGRYAMYKGWKCRYK